MEAADLLRKNTFAQSPFEAKKKFNNHFIIFYNVILH